MIAPDELRLTGLRARAFHGVFEHERRDGQEFVVDIAVELDTTAAARHDDLARTVDYGVLAEQVVRAMEQDPVDLIESLAQRVAHLVLEHDGARSVRVTVHKPQAPITVPFDDVSVTIVRGRG